LWMKLFFVHLSILTLFTTRRHTSSWDSCQCPVYNWRPHWTRALPNQVYKTPFKAAKCSTGNEQKEKEENLNAVAHPESWERGKTKGNGVKLPCQKRQGKTNNISFTKIWQTNADTKTTYRGKCIWKRKTDKPQRYSHLKLELRISTDRRMNENNYDNCNGNCCCCCWWWWRGKQWQEARGGGGGPQLIVGSVRTADQLDV